MIERCVWFFAEYIPKSFRNLDVRLFFEGSILHEYKRLCYAAFFVVCGGIVLIGSGARKAGAEEYLKAEQAVALWERSGDAESYHRMEQALKKVPDLEPKYRAFIAQKLLRDKALEEGVKMAASALTSVSQEIPFHAMYASTSLLIEKKEFQAALEQAVGLKEKMVRERSFQEENGVGSFLFAHNLLRIASLQQELKNGPGEKAAWEDLEKFLDTKPDVLQLLLRNFRDHDVDLSHYILERKKALQASRN